MASSPNHQSTGTGCSEFSWNEGGDASNQCRYAKDARGCCWGVTEDAPLWCASEAGVNAKDRLANTATLTRKAAPVWRTRSSSKYAFMPGGGHSWNVSNNYSILIAMYRASWRACVRVAAVRCVYAQCTHLHPLPRARTHAPTHPRWVILHVYFANAFAQTYTLLHATLTHQGCASRLPISRRRLGFSCV